MLHLTKEVGHSEAYLCDELTLCRLRKVIHISSANTQPINVWINIFSVSLQCFKVGIGFPMTGGLRLVHLTGGNSISLPYRVRCHIPGRTKRKVLDRPS